MADAYLGQIEIFGFNYAPKNWQFCAGQLLSIQQNQALFSLLGTTYGGDGIRTFALPDLRSRIPMGQGNGAGLTARVIGEVGGEENHTLLPSETPIHTHSLGAKSNPDLTQNVYTPDPTQVLAQTTGQDSGGNPLTFNIYAADANPNQALAPQAITPVGGQPHTNIMPYLALNFCIAMQGLFPSRN